MKKEYSKSHHLALTCGYLIKNCGRALDNDCAVSDNRKFLKSTVSKLQQFQVTTLNIHPKFGRSMSNDDWNLGMAVVRQAAWYTVAVGVWMT